MHVSVFFTSYTYCFNFVLSLRAASSISYMLFVFAFHTHLFHKQKLILRVSLSVRVVPLFVIISMHILSELNIHSFSLISQETLDFQCQALATIARRSFNGKNLLQKLIFRSSMLGYHY